MQELPELFYDFNVPPRGGAYWASRAYDADARESPNRRFSIGDRVLIGCKNDDMLLPGVVMDVSDGLIGVWLEPEAELGLARGLVQEDRLRKG